MIKYLAEEALDEGGGNLLQLSLALLAKGTFLLNGGEEISLVGPEVSEIVRLPLEDLGDRDVIEVTIDTSEDEGNHLVDSHGRVLLLLQELGQLQKMS